MYASNACVEIFFVGIRLCNMLKYSAGGRVLSRPRVCRAAGIAKVRPLVKNGSVMSCLR